MKILYLLSAIILFMYGFCMSVANLLSFNGLSLEEIVSSSLVALSSLISFALIASLNIKYERSIFSDTAVFLPFIVLLVVAFQMNGKIIHYLYALTFLATAILLIIAFFKRNSDTNV